MIDIKQLTKKDIGRWVKHTNSAGISEIGKIKNWNKKFIFVVYKCNNEWDRFKDFTGCATRSEDLIFFEGEKNIDIEPLSVEVKELEYEKEVERICKKIAKLYRVKRNNVKFEKVKIK